MTLSPPVATSPGPDAGATAAPGALHAHPIVPAPGADSLPSFRVTGTHTNGLTHGVTIDGRRTSVSLEDQYWSHLKRIAADASMTLYDLIAAADARRRRNGVKSLSGYLRLLVLQNLESRAFPGTFAARHAPRLEAADRAAAALTSTPRRRSLGGD